MSRIAAAPARPPAPVVAAIRDSGLTVDGGGAR